MVASHMNLISKRRFMSQPGWERHEKNVLNVNGEVSCFVCCKCPKSYHEQIQQQTQTEIE